MIQYDNDACWVNWDVGAVRHARQPGLAAIIRKEPVMIKRALTASCIAVIAASCTQAAGPWVRGYVVAFYDPAFRYGGRADYSRGTEIEPGIDCLHGSTTHFAIPAQVANTLSLVPWRTPKEVEALANPSATGLNRDRDGLYYATWRAAAARQVA
jgi:hypothetical protein